jgi:predicted Co/Zn/Cd cation transporter (cation efflux family)
MTTNVGTIDRIIRLLAGAALIAFALGYILPATGWNWVGWIGVAPILTALFGTCPAYSMLGVSTCQAKAA